MMREFNFTTTPIVDIVNDIIIDSVIRNASDIHFDPAEKYLKIRIRIDGELRDYAIIDNRYKRNLTTRVKLLAGMNITESRLPQDGAIKSVIEGKDLDLRVSALPTSFGEKIVIRILDYSMSLQGIEYLGFTEENFKIITELLNNPNGIILITGATGSGKSTTVYSMLQKLNKEESNIITVEDPVEMSIEGLNQVQVNSEIGLDFATVLRSILRQDPNIILIGEIRDTETAKIAVRASITGHLVLSTLHTNNSLTTIERLIDMGVERYLLSSSLKGIISQTLAKRLCPNCRIQRLANDTEKILFKKALGIDIETIYEAGRCENCHNGYTGRIALQEVLMINDEIRDAINKNIDREELRHLIYKKGVKTLFQDGLIKVIEGITDLKEVFRLVDYDEYDDISGDLIEQVNNSATQDNVYTNTTNNNNNNMVYTPSVETSINENSAVETNQNTENVINIPNYNKTEEQVINNQIIAPLENNDSIFENNNYNLGENNNLFDDNVFNSLRIDNNAETNQNNPYNSSNPSYTDELLNMINNDTNTGA
ncbi:MAG: GspE/PulE family protein [Bacilli bacterium]